MIVRARNKCDRLAVVGPPDFQRWALREFTYLIQLTAEQRATDLESEAAALQSEAALCRASAYAESRRVYRIGNARIRIAVLRGAATPHEEPR